MEKKIDTLLERMDQILALLQDVVHSHSSKNEARRAG